MSVHCVVYNRSKMRYSLSNITPFDEDNFPLYISHNLASNYWQIILYLKYCVHQSEDLFDEVDVWRGDQLGMLSSCGEQR